MSSGSECLKFVCMLSICRNVDVLQCRKSIEMTAIWVKTQPIINYIANKLKVKTYENLQSNF